MQRQLLPGLGGANALGSQASATLPVSCRDGAQAGAEASAHFWHRELSLTLHLSPSGRGKEPQQEGAGRETSVEKQPKARPESLGFWP